MKKQLIQLTVKVTEEKEKAIKKYANKYHNGNTAGAIREFIDKGLSINSYKEEITFLREMIREELESVLHSDMKAMRSLCVKSGIMSASSHFALGEVLEKLVDPKYRRGLEEVLVQNKKRGYAYMTSKDFKIE